MSCTIKYNAPKNDSQLATKNFLVAKTIIDKFNKILDFTKWSNEAGRLNKIAKDTYNLSENILSSEQQGKVASFNKSMFDEIDRQKTIIQQPVKEGVSKLFETNFPIFAGSKTSDEVISKLLSNKIIDKKMQLNSGVYKIVNIQNGDFYIGSSINLSLREKNHFNKLKHGKHVNTYLQNVYVKYGKESLKFEILATCPKEYCIKLEQWFINNLTPKYNFLKIAGSSLGYKHSKETLEIMKSKYNRDVLPKLQEGNKKYFKERNSKYKQVALLLKEGKTQKEICLFLNMNNQQFWLLKNQAITKGALEKQLSKKDLFLSMYKQGKSRIEIIQELNLTSVGYRNYKHKYIKDGL